MELKGKGDLNVKLETITKEQQELKDEIKLMKDRKEMLVDEVIKSNVSGIEDIEKDINTIRHALSNAEYTIAFLDDHLFEIYKTVFKGIVSKRVKTEITSKDSTEQVWFNTKGLAYPSWRGRQAKSHKNITTIINIIKNHPELVDYIGNDSKKKVFNIFRECVANWILIPRNSETIYKTKYEVSLVEDHEDKSEFGVDKILLKTYNFLEFSLSKNEFKVSMKEEDNSWYWGTKNYSTKKELDERARFVLYQLPDDAIKEIKKNANHLTKVLEDNYKYVKELERRMTPFLVARRL